MLLISKSVHFSLLLMVINSSAQADDDLTGAKVVLKYAIPLRFEDRVVDDGSTFRIYTIERKNGGELLVISGGVKGWVPSSEVVPFSKAVQFYTNEILALPGRPEPYRLRGLIRTSSGDLDQAIRDFDEAIRLEPNDAATYFDRAFTLAERKEFDRAIADYDQAIRIDPGYAAAYVNRGNVRFSRKEFDRAIADYDQAIRIDPDDSLAYLLRGNTWISQDNFDKAIVNYDKAISLGRSDASSYFQRGLAHYGKEDHRRAIADLSEAIRLDPANPRAFIERGGAYAQIKNFKYALLDFDESIRLYPNESEPFRLRAWVWASCTDAAIRDGKRAVQSATRSCELSAWKDADALESLAASFAELGDFDQAVKWEREAIKLNEDAAIKVEFEHRLSLYERKMPYRLQKDNLRVE
jgi:tetratricopeptide (TPR) repeat protein